MKFTGEKDKIFGIGGIIAIAIFFILIIALAVIYHPGGVLGEFGHLASSIASPFVATANGMASLIVSFFTNLWNHITGFFSGIGKSVGL